MLLVGIRIQGLALSERLLADVEASLRLHHADVNLLLVLAQLLFAQIEAVEKNNAVDDNSAKVNNHGSCVQGMQIVAAIQSDKHFEKPELKSKGILL